MSIFTVAFWRAAGERAVKSAAQGALLIIAADQANVFRVNWQEVGGLALGAAVLSVLTSIGSDALTNGTGPSLTNAEVVTPETPGDGGAVNLVVALLVLILLGVVLLFLGFGANVNIR